MGGGGVGCGWRNFIIGGVLYRFLGASWGVHHEGYMLCLLSIKDIQETESFGIMFGRGFGEENFVSKQLDEIRTKKMREYEETRFSV